MAALREIILHGRGPNTLSLTLLESLERDLDAAGDDPLLLTGAGNAFSSGLDLKEVAAGDAGYIARLIDTMERAARKLFLHPGPTVALVNGHAIAGGCVFVQCCDARIAVADPAVLIGMTGVAIGLEYPPFVFGVLQARLPPGVLDTVVLGADRHSPAGALSLGLLDRVVEGDARAAAVAELERRAALPRHAYAAAKQRLRARAFVDSEADQRVFREQVFPNWTEKLKR
jgi:enoyl-CoA hydratase/carnithine racemase